MSINFKPATRQNVSLLIGISGQSGSGKTFSALRMASGISKGNPFAVIDTERGRARHYADKFKFDTCDLEAPFRPDLFAEAIIAADNAKYPVIVVDSVSHVWSGEGGVLDWVEEELERMAGSDWKKRESCRMAAYIKPKMSHKQMVQKLLQIRAHVILCFRAAPKVEMSRDEKTGKMVITEKQTLTSIQGFIPECEKNLPFELTASFLMTADKPGYPKPIKLQEQHRALFPLDQPIDERSGELVAAWAAGGLAAAPTPAIFNPMVKRLETAIANAGFNLDDVLTAWKKSSLADVADESKAMEWIQKAVDRLTTMGSNAAPSTGNPPKQPFNLDAFTRLVNETTDIDLLKAHGALITELHESEQDAAGEILSYRTDELRNK